MFIKSKSNYLVKVNVGGSGIIDSSFSGEVLSVGNTEPITITVSHHTVTAGEDE